VTADEEAQFAKLKWEKDYEALLRLAGSPLTLTTDEIAAISKPRLERDGVFRHGRGTRVVQHERAREAMDSVRAFEASLQNGDVQWPPGWRRPDDPENVDVDAADRPGGIRWDGPDGMPERIPDDASPLDLARETWKRREAARRSDRPSVTASAARERLVASFPPKRRRPIRTQLKVLRDLFDQHPEWN
jgi:hypothetical protein